MNTYKLYTLVDITHSRKYTPHTATETAKRQEQNFNTILQTLGIRANIFYNSSPIMSEIKGSLIGFDTDDFIRVWRFDFYTEQDSLYESENDPVVLLKKDFNLVPYIQGLNELMEQKYAVFVTTGIGKNIIFFKI